MTTIATDGKVMASDGRSCQGDLVVSEDVTKLSIARDGSVVGCAGERAICDLVHDWFRDGERPDAVPNIRVSVAGAKETLFDCLILRPDGTVWFMDGNYRPVEHRLPAAIGSGAEIALGLMLAGLAPAEAIEQVAGRVCTVGGTIRSAKPKGKISAHR